MRAPDIFRIILQKTIRLYAYALSPLTGAKCRFHPTCSHYAHEALEKHGIVGGLYLTFRRLLKCHPWHKGPMIDPVPTGIDRVGIIGYKRAKPAQKD
jgi:uncharacterized protein